jgi:hypothetical protein
MSTPRSPESLPSLRTWVLVFALIEALVLAVLIPLVLD